MCEYCIFRVSSFLPYSNFRVLLVAGADLYGRAARFRRRYAPLFSFSTMRQQVPKAMIEDATDGALYALTYNGDKFEA